MTYNTAVESQIYATCPHSDGKSAPICWDCSEESWRSPPQFEDFGGVKKLRILSGKNQTFAPEVHPPAEGIEVGTPNSRSSQPGLEVFTGPQIVIPTDKPRNIGLDEKIVITSDSPSPTILGLRRRIFWLVLICVVLALLVGVAVGTAVGITQKNNSTKALSTSSSSTGIGDQMSSTFSSPPEVMTEIVSVITASPSMTATSGPTILSVSSSTKLDTSTTTEKKSSSSASPTSSSPAGETSKSVEKVTVISVQTASVPTTSPVQSTPTPTTITVTPTSKTSSETTASPATTSSDGDCLGADGSTYTDPGTGSQFRIECDIAHQGKDIDNYEAQTMQACVSMCADDSECVGAIWYSAGPQGTDLNYCWLKSTLDDDLKSTKDAQSVVRL
ncbi:uncharacterized protein F4807DRAFT_258619 [Annulohypoxylon truncatum]|uniref:uncharacterized protein n=1 Tax=Annulohypoxylon truncatum TaxID=327061 RepID=UPI0020082FDD|nr:uncharacterized protein F4807DRAFT_258619 [Annulohypoxylon truncatum]KAI1213309.1 hypothetical protein F4807DRAFT_258619 [Annulohypoxylon truncatum]